MKTIQVWDYVTEDQWDEALNAMSLSERQELDMKIKKSVSSFNMSFSERSLAKDFFMKGYLMAFMHFLTDQEKEAQKAIWDAEDAAKRANERS